MNDAIDLAPTVSTEATLPLTSAADGQSATGRSIQEIVLADQYVNNKAAVLLNRFFGLRMAPISTPGAGPRRHGGGGFDSAGFGGW
jgi:hypothetical protein